MCHEDQHWTEALPLVLLGISSACKTDLHASVAELVYGEPLRIPGEPLRIPGELLTPSKQPPDTSHLITQLRRNIAKLRPIPATHHTNPGTFVHKDLNTCTHDFLRHDAARLTLQPPYSGPYLIKSRSDKTITLIRGKLPPAVLLKDRPERQDSKKIRSSYQVGI
jgi:hypothetical protein